jgi:hypothetical protein
LHNLELEGQDTVKDVSAIFWRVDGRQDGEDIGAFGGGLIEEAKTGEAGETEVP